MIQVYFFRKLVSFVPASILRTNACDFYTCGVIGSVNKLTENKNCLHKSARPQQSPRLSTLSGARDVTRPNSLSITVPFKSLTSLTGEKMAAIKTAILLLADGAEEMEAVITADVLRRAGIDVTLASITGNEFIKCSRNVTIVADGKLEAAIIKDQKYDVVILPGGLGGSKALAKSAEVGALLKTQEKENRMIAAICAAPTVLKAHGIAKGKRITSYPSMKDQLTADYEYLSEKVVIDGNLITSQGPATAYNFGLAIAEKLLNKETALKVASDLLFQDYK